jgi:ketosteroid isomerase-like protein
MANQASTDHQAIRSAVRAINEHWRGKQYDRLGALLAAEAVIAPPGFGRRIRGRDAYVQSYRDYDEAATTVAFSAGDPEVDIIGDVAVAVCPFRVVYEISGTTHREHGHDILVLSRLRGEWKVVWRTMQTAPAGEEGV